jgi:LmbE family N-acetylglucosaminyl deacetylase
MWASPGGQRVLIVALHPDDEAIGCAGTLLAHTHAGDSVSAAYITDGRGSRALGLTPAEMIPRRRAEAETAAHLLRVTRLEWLDLPEGEWTNDQLAPRLRALLADCAPEVCYLPSRVDFHPEHWRVAETLAPLLPDSLTVRVYPVQVPLMFGLVNLVADVSADAPAIEMALAAYITQAQSVACGQRQRRYAAAFYRCPQLAEIFWEMPARVYRHLHSPAVWRARDSFRGLRPRPWTDPLAYLQGWLARRDLRAQAEQ